MAGLDIIGQLANMQNTAIGTLFNVGKSMFGARQLKNLGKRPVAPTYEIPTAVKTYLAQKNIAADKGLPGEDIIREQIGANVAGTIGDVNKSATSSAAALGAVTDVRQRAQDAIRNLGVRSAEYQAQKEAEATDAQRYMADYQEKAWEYNKNLPYQRKMNEWMSNRSAAMQNLMGGIEGMGSSLVQGSGNAAYQTQMQDLINAVKGGQVTPSSSVGSTYTPVSGSGANAPNLGGYPSWQAYLASLKYGG